MAQSALVTGAGGFIGHHLVSYLKDRGYWVRGVDIRLPEFEATQADEFELLDLRRWDNCLLATRGIEMVYHLAADMGGIGYITAYHADIARNNTLINTHMLEAAWRNGIQKFFFSSSACIYPQYKQNSPDLTPLREEDAYPADPEEGYGWEKLFMEKLCQYYCEDHGMQTYVARFHNIFGPQGTWEGGKEKAPAALCRKIAIARLTGNPEVEIWGDGEQTRSFCYIDDLLEGVYRLVQSDYHQPLNIGQDRLNIGQDRMVTIDELADIIAGIAGVEISKKHIPGPQGVRGRNSDNTRLQQVLRWEPQISLEEGLTRTYVWIEQQVKEKYKL